MDAKGLEGYLVSDWMTITGDAPKASIALSARQVIAGQPVTVSWEISGGKEPYKILPGSGISAGDITFPFPEGVNTTTIRPTSGNFGYVTLSLEDAVGARFYETASFSILYDSDLSVSASLDKSIVKPGDSLTASWVITGGKPPYVVEGEWGNSGLPSPMTGTSVTKTVNLHYNNYFRIHVTDATGYKVSVVTGPAAFVDQSRVTITFTPANPKPGDTVVASVNVPGTDTAGAYYSYSWDLDGVRQRGVYGISSASDRLNVTQNGVLVLNVQVTPKAGGPMQGYAAVEVVSASPPIDVELLLDKTTVAVNTPLTASWTITGGDTPTAKPVWLLSNDAYSFTEFSGEAAGNTSSFTPRAGVRGKLRLVVTDQQHQVKTVESPVFVITGAAQTPPLEVHIDFDKASVFAGQTITANWTITGGVPPYTVEEVMWEVTEGWDYVTITDTEMGGSASLQVPKGTSGMLHVTVRDYMDIVHATSNVFRVVVSNLRGDNNGDGRLGIEDVRALANHLINGATLLVPANADADGVAGITMGDLVWLVKELIGG